MLLLFSLFTVFYSKTFPIYYKIKKNLIICGLHRNNYGFQCAGHRTSMFLIIFLQPCNKGRDYFLLYSKLKETNISGGKNLSRIMQLVHGTARLCFWSVLIQTLVMQLLGSTASVCQFIQCLHNTKCRNSEDCG